MQRQAYIMVGKHQNCTILSLFIVNIISEFAINMAFTLEIAIHFVPFAL